LAISTDRKPEAKVSQQIKHELNRLGLFCVKISQKFVGGTPDLYAVGGNWIETKVIYRGTPGRRRSPLSEFTAQQKWFLDHATAKGDNCFAAIYWFLDEDNTFFLFAPWYEFRRIRSWDLQSLTLLSLKVNKGDSFQMERFFRAEGVPHHWDPGIWWGKRFKMWLDQPGSVWEDKTDDFVPASAEEAGFE
jgi:hypothetical protein